MTVARDNLRKIKAKQKPAVRFFQHKKDDSTIETTIERRYPCGKIETDFIETRCFGVAIIKR